MRNLKRALSLVLATVMVIGMMVVGASAASYDDAADINYTEAVDVMTAVGMISGIGNGDFAPTATIDRAGAAKLIAYLMLGKKTADAIKPTENPFNDVDKDAWYAGYMSYCKAEGLMQGYNGNADPTGTITAYGFGTMLLAALGYDRGIEGLTGDAWEVNTAKLAITNGLFKGNDTATGNAPMTREEACLYAFNALKATTVEYSTKGTSITVDGTVINTGASKATPVKPLDADAEHYAGGDKNETVELCEALYPELTLVTDEPGDFGRPGNTWKIDDEAVAFSAKKTLATYTKGDFDQDARDAWADKDYVISAEKTNVWYNGSKDPSGFPVTRNMAKPGYIVELYADGKTVTDIVISEGYVSQVTDVETDEDDNVTSVTVHVLEKVAEATENGTIELTFEAGKDNQPNDFDLVKDLEKDDIFMGFYVLGFEDKNEAETDNVLAAIDTDLDTVEGKATAISIDGNHMGWVKIDGVKYTFAHEYSYATVSAAKDNASEGTFYLYNGYVVHFDGTAGDENVDTQAAYVLNARVTGSDWAADTEKTYEAQLLLADGSVEVVEVTEEFYNAFVAAEGSAFTAGVTAYTVDKDGVYDLDDEAVVAVDTLTGGATAEFTKNKAELGTAKVGDADAETYYAHNNTTLVVMNYKDGKFADADVYTGIKNLPSMKVTAYAIVADEDSVMADYVFCTYSADVSATAEDLIYVAGSTVSAKIEDSTLGEYYTYTAVVNGKIVEIKATNENADGLYDGADVDENGVYTFDTAISEGTDSIKVGGTKVNKAANGVITIDGEPSVTMTYVEDLPIFVEKDEKLTSGSITKSYEGTVIYTVKDNTITSVFVNVPADEA